MDKQWYYARSDAEKYGPYSDEELVELIRNGTVRENDYIWMSDLKNWLKVGDSIYSIFLPGYTE